MEEKPVGMEVQDVRPFASPDLRHRDGAHRAAVREEKCGWGGSQQEELSEMGRRRQAMGNER